MEYRTGFPISIQLVICHSVAVGSLIISVFVKFVETVSAVVVIVGRRVVKLIKGVKVDEVKVAIDGFSVVNFVISHRLPLNPCGQIHWKFPSSLIREIHLPLFSHVAECNSQYASSGQVANMKISL